MHQAVNNTAGRPISGEHEIQGVFRKACGDAGDTPRKEGLLFLALSMKNGVD